MRCMLKKFRSCVSPGIEQLCLLAKLWYSIVYDKQETQLSQRDRGNVLFRIGNILYTSYSQVVSPEFL